MHTDDTHTHTYIRVNDNKNNINIITDNIWLTEIIADNVTKERDDERW